jgi:hypothetical protein
MCQVNLILATGKSVAFLRDLCDNVMEMKWAGLDAALSTATNSKKNIIFLQILILLVQLRVYSILHCLHLL